VPLVGRGVGVRGTRRKQKVSHARKNGPIYKKPTYSRTLLTGAILALCLSWGNAWADPNMNLPDMGGTAQAYLSTEEERRMGEAFMRSVRRSVKIITDPEIDDYIQTLGYRLASYGAFKDREFSFFVVDSPVINAFAGPGGHIGIHSGLILITESESELASVVAHEIAHVTQRHIARAVEAASRSNIPMTAALIAALILSSQDAQMGTAALAATTAGSIQRQINFTRGNEKEADRIGIQILADANFDPRRMPLFFDRMRRASMGPENPQFEFLRTHPVTTSRIADTRNRAEQYPQGKYRESLNYALIKARLRVLAEKNPQRSKAYFAARMEKEGAHPSAATRYGYALALLKTGDYADAHKLTAQLAQQDPDRIAYQIHLARIKMAAGRIDDALAIFRDNLALYPNNKPLTMLYANALIQTGQPDKASKVLRDYLREKRESTPLYYSLLAQAESDSGNQVAAHQALAEYYDLVGQTASAIAQLKIAIEGVKEEDAIRQAQIKARLKVLREQLRQEEDH